ncbi:hypothetical protein Tco_1294453 [Tanacetum coccineum]
MDKGVVDTVKNHKRQHDDDDDDDDEETLAGLNQGNVTPRKFQAPFRGVTGTKTKRRRTKELESSKKPSTTKETSKGKAQSKSSKTGKFATTKEPVEEPIAKVVMDDAVNTAGEDVVRDDDQLQDTSEPKTYKTPNQDWTNLQSVKGTCTSNIELEYNFQECFNALADKLDWNNPEGDRYPFDLSKPLPLSQMNKFSKHNVHSTQKILCVKSVSVKKLHGYGHLEEIVVKRTDRQLYKFKEGVFMDLYLNDIEDIASCCSTQAIPSQRK